MLNSNKKLISAIAAMALVIIIGGGIVLFVVEHEANVNEFVFTVNEVTPKKIDFRVTSLSSANAVTGYDYRIVNETVYISIKEVYLVSKLNESGGMGARIIDDFEGVNRVYFEGKDDIQEVWVK